MASNIKLSNYDENLFCSYPTRWAIDCWNLSLIRPYFISYSHLLKSVYEFQHFKITENTFYLKGKPTHLTLFLSSFNVEILCFYSLFYFRTNKGWKCLIFFSKFMVWGPWFLKKIHDGSHIFCVLLQFFTIFC